MRSHIGLVRRALIIYQRSKMFILHALKICFSSSSCNLIILLEVVRVVNCIWNLNWIVVLTLKAYKQEKKLWLTDGLVMHLARIWSGPPRYVGLYRPGKQPGADIFILSDGYIDIAMHPPEKSSSSFSALVALSNGVGE